MSSASPPSAPDPAAKRARTEGTDGEQRIAKLLARAGVASRREIERMIAEGRVELNGSVLTTPATVLASLAGVTVDGHPVEAPAPARLFLYHKPAGLLVTERDPGGRPTIYDRLPAGLPRVVPVGRLDLGTEGLLLLTTDGGLKRQLELPATGVERAYRARAYGDVTQQMLEALIEGVEIEGVRYGSIDANLERRTGANVWIEMVLTEGKNREVRRVLEYLGLRVSRLIRTRYGPFVLGDLKPGAVVEGRAHDIASFRKNPTRLDLPQPARQRADAPPSGGLAAAATTSVRPAQRRGPVTERPPERASPSSGRSGQSGRRTGAPAVGSERGASDARASAGRAPVRNGGLARGAAHPGRPRRAGTDTGHAVAAQVRPGARPERTDPIAKPARAARARAFRDSRQPDEQPRQGGRQPRPVAGERTIRKAADARPASTRPPAPDRPKSSRPHPDRPSPARPSSGRTTPAGPSRSGRPGGGKPRPPRARG